MKDIDEWAAALEKSDEDSLAFFWRCRLTLDKPKRFKMRQMIWDECERRYEGMTRKPIEVRMPYFGELDARSVMQTIRDAIKSTAWPEFLKEWHCSKVKLVTSAQPSLEDILSNVNKPWYEHRGCTCMRVRRRMSEAGYGGALPQTCGHVFFTGREYDGPCKPALNVCTANVPTQTRWNLTRAWEKVYNGLPAAVQIGSDEWAKRLSTCIGVTRKQARTGGTPFPTSWEAYKLRKLLEGLVIGPLDKNKGELWACCPVLYNRALKAAYCEATGYERIFPAKLSAYRKKRYSNSELPEQIIRTQEMPERQRGTADDIVKMWRRIYMEKGWNKFAAFRAKAGFNKPYILFKAKNVVDPTVRGEKWMKVRPIAPGTKHPMRRLLGLVGRAWSFATANMVGDHFVIKHGGEVPQFLREAEAMSAKGDLGYMIQDIESCYPAMPKEAIRFGMRKVAADIKRALGHDGVTVPLYATTKPCTWGKPGRTKSVHIPWENMLDVMEFALDNAIVTLGKGVLLRQKGGIPMGDPISPGMTVGTCGWMEHEWMQTLAYRDRGMFKAKRYMDDILAVYVKSPDWDHAKFVKDFKRSECYHAPLKLEDGKPGTFLETSFEWKDGRFRHWIKNENKQGEEPKVWRYKDFRSHGPYTQKRALITMIMKKVHHMASDKTALTESAIQKLAEFERLNYPRGLLVGVCNYMGATTGENAWIRVRERI